MTVPVDLIPRVLGRLRSSGSIDPSEGAVVCLGVGGEVRLWGWGGGRCSHTFNFTPGSRWVRTRPGDFSKKNLGTSDPEERGGAQEAGPSETG